MVHTVYVLTYILHEDGCRRSVRTQASPVFWVCVHLFPFFSLSFPSNVILGEAFGGLWQTGARHDGGRGPTPIRHGSGLAGAAFIAAGVGWLLACSERAALLLLLLLLHPSTVVYVHSRCDRRFV